jgi:hypothetical protein
MLAALTSSSSPGAPNVMKRGGRNERHGIRPVPDQADRQPVQRRRQPHRKNLVLGPFAQCGAPGAASARALCPLAARLINTERGDRASSARSGQRRRPGFYPLTLVTATPTEGFSVSQ